MVYQFILCLILSSITLSKCNVILWGSKQVSIPSFKELDEETFAELLQELGNPKVLAFEGNTKGNISKLAFIRPYIEEKGSSYLFYFDLDLDNVTILTGHPDVDKAIIDKQIKALNNKNYLALIYDKERVKRSVVQDERTFAITSKEVLYTTLDTEAMLYSSRHPKLFINKTTETLGHASTVTLNRRGQITKMVINIPVQNSSKITLNIRFQWDNDYWTIKSMELQRNSEIYNLTSTTPIKAIRRFSYHCTGQTEFHSDDHLVKIIFYDLQVQPDTKLNFGPAYDCATFMTAPIWSGIFVTSIFLVVLFIGFAALGDIKTMDKFDNNKQKSLSFTISNE